MRGSAGSASRAQPKFSPRLLDYLQLRAALLATLTRSATIFRRCRPARRLRSEVLLREHHALAGLARVDPQHGGNRDAYVMHDSSEPRIELDVLIAQVQPLRGARAEIEHDLAVLHVGL